MQIHRLFEMLYLLLERENVTAPELAKRFEVSPRTVYRDVDVLSAAGIPVYAVKGKGGGIRLLPGFTLDKSVLSQEDKSQLLIGLQNLAAIEIPDADEALSRMAAVLGKSHAGWLEVDYSPWYGGSVEKERFLLLRDGVLSRQLVEFGYYSRQGEKSHRQVEPLKMVFKGQWWYLYGYCRAKQGERIFKLSRMEDVSLIPGTEGVVTRTPPEKVVEAPPEEGEVLLVMKADAKIAYRIYDEFLPEEIQQLEDGSCMVRKEMPDGEGMHGYLLSLGEWVEVLESEHFRRGIKRSLEKMLEKYK